MNGFCLTCQKVQLLNIETSECTNCGTRWRPLPMVQPKRSYILSEDDRQFLRSGGIKP